MEEIAQNRHPLNLILPSAKKRITSTQAKETRARTKGVWRKVNELCNPS